MKKRTTRERIKYNLLFMLYIIIVGVGNELTLNNKLGTWETWLGILIMGGGYVLIEELIRRHTRKQVVLDVANGVKRVAGNNSQVVVFYSKLENDWKIAYENGESELLTEAIDNAKRDT